MTLLELWAYGSLVLFWLGLAGLAFVGLWFWAGIVLFVLHGGSLRDEVGR